MSDLREALRPRYDKFYEEQPKVMFNACGLGFFKDDEGERAPNADDEKEKEKKEDIMYGSGSWMGTSMMKRPGSL